MKVAVWGGGISGLTAAWRLRKEGHEVSLFETSDRLGGAIWTDRSLGALFERGPRTFVVSRSPHLLALISEVGLERELIFSKPQSRYLLFRGKLRPLSYFIPRLIGPLVRECFRPRGVEGDETIAAFATRRFGPWVADVLFDPLTRGIYGGDPELLSIQACFPVLKEWERTYGSVVRGVLKAPKKNHALFTLRGGMDRLIERLSEGLVVRREAPKFEEWDRVIVALSSEGAARALPLFPQIPTTKMTVVNVLYPMDRLPRSGYGYLVPRREGGHVLGAIFDSSIFPEQDVKGTTRVSVFLREGGDITEATDALSRHLSISASPIGHLVTPVSLPQLQVGHDEKIAALKRAYPHLIFLGNYLQGVSVDACVNQKFTI